MEKFNIKNKNANDQYWLQPILILFVKLSAWIGAPLVSGVVIGKWIDRRQGGGQYWIFICIGVAFLITMMGLGKSALDAYREIDSFIKK